MHLFFCLGSGTISHDSNTFGILGHFEMRKLLATSTMAISLAFSANHAIAADYEAQVQQLVVSGVVEQWSGYTFLSNISGSNFDPQSDGYFSSGTSGRLSLPLGEMLSIQMDGDLEYTENAFAGDDSFDTFEASGQGGLHLSYRNPDTGLIGGFVSFGVGRDDFSRSSFIAVGGEAQFYTGDMTFYLQGGHLDSTSGSNGQEADDSFHDAFFVRGVARWFITPDSRLQGEISYVDGEQDTGDSYDMDIVEWNVRYDTILMGLPVIGDTSVFVGYRGARFDNEGGGAGADDGQYTEHTIMVGTSHSFGGSSKREFDRVGATLDLPNFGRWIISGSSLD